MDYTKSLLTKENVEIKKYGVLASLFEMLSNHESINNIGKKSLSLLKELEGEVALLQYSEDKFHLVSFLGSKEVVEKHLEERTILKRVKNEKKPFFGETEGDPFLVFPIFSKENFLGALCIYNKQKIACWEEIYTALHLLALAFKHYELVDEVKSSSVKDNITKLFNYRHFQDLLEIELEKATRFHEHLSMITIDIKNFRLINEKLGREAGDEVLNQVATIIEKTCRKIDMPSRLNADTFTILLSKTNVLGAYIVLNRILMRLNRHKFLIQGKEFKIKIKGSATGYDVHDVGGKLFLEEAKSSLREWTLPELAQKIEQLTEEFSKESTTKEEK